MAVLVVDDDLDLVDSLVEILADHGFATFGASNKRDALRILVDARDVIRLILLDYRMPGIHGWELGELLDNAQVPIVTMTASDGIAPFATAVDALAKPFDLEDLLRTVRAHHGAPP
jgi:DNA-binding response OmpR family regulator